ncbi:hypothetical protein HPB51_016624 [Rhipicephalus microplus]|uniref:Uncharacterized protein n=1 Tax=Rhipicephalus microplus TaxID=6941 RepID=A0A9J6EI80_RHIMP|nr:hypothetical protein HPB51_016624 [Rhipicephalus microplus]
MHLLSLCCEHLLSRFTAGSRRCLLPVRLDTALGQLRRLPCQDVFAVRTSWTFRVGLRHYYGVDRSSRHIDGSADFYKSHCSTDTTRHADAAGTEDGDIRISGRIFTVIAVVVVIIGILFKHKDATTTAPCATASATSARAVSTTEASGDRVRTVTEASTSWTEAPSVSSVEVRLVASTLKVRVFFEERVKPWAVAKKCAATVTQFYGCTLKYLFTNRTAAYENLLREFQPNNVADIVRFLAMLMSGCDTHRIAKSASKAGYHYIMEGPGRTLFEPVLDVDVLTAFLKNG